MPIPQHLVLFDIDGTLLRTRKRGIMAFARALQETYGLEVSWQGYRPGGKTDPQIINELMTSAGLTAEAIQAKENELKAKYFLYLQEMVKTADDMTIMPGVTKLLEELRQRPECLIGLLTGNFKKGADLKLSLCGLHHYFQVGAYGDDSSDRNKLPAFAMDRATQLTGLSFSGKNVIIIGDTVYDVRCGKTSGLKTIAVATGGGTEEELKEEKPDYCFKNLSDTAEVIRSIISESV